MSFRLRFVAISGDQRDGQPPASPSDPRWVCHRPLVLFAPDRTIGADAKPFFQAGRNGARSDRKTTGDGSVIVGLAMDCLSSVPRATLALAVLLVSSCERSAQERSTQERSTEEECISQNPVRSSADVQGDGMFYRCPPPAPGSPPPTEPCDISTSARAERECAADGTPCAGKIQVSRDAAFCIVGKLTDLSSLTNRPLLELRYNSTEKVQLWEVFILYGSGPLYGGKHLDDKCHRRLVSRPGPS